MYVYSIYLHVIGVIIKKRPVCFEFQHSENGCWFLQPCKCYRQFKTLIALIQCKKEKKFLMHEHRVCS